MAKRLFDIVFSILALAMLGPWILLIAVLVRLDSPGDPIFRQRRAGWRGRPFEMYKFRTMRTDADPYGMSPHSEDDPRLTRMGKWLREKSLDEFPQLWNVLSGSMSLVGPRPLYERQAEQWNERQQHRLDVRPGITGYAQVTGRASIPIEEKIELDLFYVEHRNLAMDISLLWKTLANAVRGEAEIYEKQYSRDQAYEVSPDETPGRATDPG
jgi:lipopolysaccharide/colanic/teichoic acid biosynthesis glycosyltransferase